MQEARSKQILQETVFGESVFFEYKKGKKLYFEECVAGMERMVGRHQLCCKFSCMQ